MKKLTLEGFNDDRGQLFWFGDEELNFFSYDYITAGTIEPGCSRGGHYHKKNKERLVCIIGKLRFDLDDKSIIMGPGDVVKVPLRKTHTLTNIGDKTAFFIQVNGMGKNKDSKDTFRRKQ